MKNWIVSAVLILALIGAIAGGVSYGNRYAAIIEENEAKVASAQAELDAAVAEKNGVSPLDSTDELQRIAAEQELLAQAQGEIDRLNAENGDMDASIAQLEQTLSEKQADEEYAYYKAAYDSMAEGRAIVESYLEDH